MKKQIDGTQLQVGDTIEVWWSPRRDTITALTPYTGPLNCVDRVATFALLKNGMSICHGDQFTLLARAGVQ